ncbi:hypothetical protein NDU88_006757 [Pleurodeles waltl]|uniref:Uncharacterized protein n=1 Tax=Pleurodeles waltl TaxID=8319 RepID=A0AAV7NR51_PLEWA|nr:hypothetical protein NDU88_006757 [Pleurodeles waltl]
MGPGAVRAESAPVGRRGRAAAELGDHGAGAQPPGSAEVPVIASWRLGELPEVAASGSQDSLMRADADRNVEVEGAENKVSPAGPRGVLRRAIEDCLGKWLPSAVSEVRAGATIGAALASAMPVGACDQGRPELHTMTCGAAAGGHNKQCEPLPAAGPRRAPHELLA